MYLLNLYRELRIWYKIRQAAKENEEILNKNGFRVDWVGRIYTVINLPEEVINQPISKEGYVLMKLRDYDKIFLDLGIATEIFPELMELKDTDSYLLILSPDRDYIKFYPFLWFLIKFIAMVFALRLVYKILYTYWDNICIGFNSIYNWFIN